MSEQRKNQQIDEFRRSGQKVLRPREWKNKIYHLRGKQVFLTDTQTSDYTKSSGEMDAAKIEYLEATVRGLRKQNQQLKQAIVSFKTSEFYQINEEKLKEFIAENDKLKLQVNNCRKELEQSLVERDFLTRFNKNLRNQCEALTKEILHLKNSNKILFQRKQKTSAISSSSQDLQKVYRSASSEIILSRKGDKRKRETATSQTIQALNSDYFIGRSIKRKKNSKH